MPSAAIESSTDEPRKYVEPHKRKSGPFDQYEVEDAARHIERADEIKANPKLVEAVAKHHAAKAKRHGALAKSMRGHMKRGLVSEKQFDKASKKHHG